MFTLFKQEQPKRDEKENEGFLGEKCYNLFSEMMMRKYMDIFQLAWMLIIFLFKEQMPVEESQSI